MHPSPPSALGQEELAYVLAFQSVGKRLQAQLAGGGFFHGDSGALSMLNPHLETNGMHVGTRAPAVTGLYEMVTTMADSACAWTGGCVLFVVTAHHYLVAAKVDFWVLREIGVVWCVWSVRMILVVRQAVEYNID